MLERLDCDVLSPLDVRYRMEEINPDHVVNCAGISDAENPRQEILTNLYGSIVVAEEARGRDIILIASVAGLYGKPGHVGYSASKAGVISVVQSLAMEGERIWAISPGRVDTPMRERDYPGDTPGSRLSPQRIGRLVQDILVDPELWPPGLNIILRKSGLDREIMEIHEGDGWAEKLRVGQPVTI